MAWQVVVDYVGESNGNVRLPGIMMLGYYYSFGSKKSGGAFVRGNTIIITIVNNIELIM